MPVAHIVTFTPTTTNETIDSLTHALDDISRTCTGIESYRHGADLSLREGTADYAISAAFRDRDALYAYLTDPGHQRITAELAPFVAAKSSVQFHID